jgi:hypothetical protein
MSAFMRRERKFNNANRVRCRLIDIAFIRSARANLPFDPAADTLKEYLSTVEYRAWRRADKIIDVLMRPIGNAMLYRAAVPGAKRPPKRTIHLFKRHWREVRRREKEETTT